MDVVTRWRRRRALRRTDLPAGVRAWLSAPWPDPSLPWQEARYAVLDLETTGLDRRADAILAIGLVEVAGGRIQLSTAWQTLVRPPPDVPLRIEAIRVHGLLPETVRAAPPVGEVLPELLERLEGRILVIHVGDFDRPFLDRVLRAHHRCGLWMPTLDTARLAAFLEQIPVLARPENVDVPLRRLCDLARGYGIPVGRQHDALADALTCAQLLLALATRLEGLGYGTVGRLCRAGR